ncbi:MAG: MerR family transcriptional regulator [Ignavibacteriales bacterium]|nr:MerR family transcriptional regulator [Ignavibacteriales bacterium]
MTHGLYTVSEAATYSRLHYSTLHRWMEINEFKILNGEKFITFLDFIQALAIRDIRRQHNISLQKIREALNRAKEAYDITHPFAMNHTTFLLEKDIHIKLKNDSDLTQLTGKQPGQMTMKSIIEVYLQDLTFGASGLAIEYKPYTGITMNPLFNFGEPILEKTKLPAFVLWEAVQSEGSFENAANAYGISVDEVIIASKYIETLNLQAA